MRPLLLAFVLAGCTRAAPPPAPPAPAPPPAPPIDPAPPPAAPPDPVAAEPAPTWSAEVIRAAVRDLTPHHRTCPYDQPGCACAVGCRLRLPPAADPAAVVILTWAGPPATAKLELHADGLVHACTAPGAAAPQPCPR